MAMAISSRSRVMPAIPGLNAPLRRGGEETALQAAAPAQALSPYSDGLPWDPDRVGQQIARIYGRILNDLIQIGKYLLWACESLDRDQFQGWLVQYFPESTQTAKRYMLLARRIDEAHDQGQVRKFLELTAGDSISKAVDLLRVSDDEIEEALDSGAFLERPIEEVGSMSYRQIKKELDRQKETVKHLTERRRELESEVSQLRQEKYAPQSDELEQKVMRVVMAMGELAVHLEGLPLAERYPKSGRILSPIQAQYDQIVTLVGFDQDTEAAS